MHFQGQGTGVKGKERRKGKDKECFRVIKGKFPTPCTQERIPLLQSWWRRTTEDPIKSPGHNNSKCIFWGENHHPYPCYTPSSQHGNYTTASSTQRHPAEPGWLQQILHHKAKPWQKSVLLPTEQTVSEVIRSSLLPADSWGPRCPSHHGRPSWGSAGCGPCGAAPSSGARSPRGSSGWSLGSGRNLPSACAGNPASHPGTHCSPVDLSKRRGCGLVAMLSRALLSRPMLPAGTMSTLWTTPD